MVLRILLKWFCVIMLQVKMILYNYATGHGDSNSKNFPTRVADLSGIGQVACGGSHTLAVSQEGKHVWSFGGGDNGMWQGSMCGHNKDVVWINEKMLNNLSCMEISVKWKCISFYHFYSLYCEKSLKIMKLLLKQRAMHILIFSQVN